MYAAFVRLLNMSAAAGILIAVVIAVRFLLRKIPKKYICILWALVALRLICPFSFSSAVSAYNYIGPSAQSSGQVEYIRYNGKGEKPKAEIRIAVPSQAGAESPAAPSRDFYLPTLMELWAAGCAIMLLYAAFSYGRVRIQVRESIPLERRNYSRDIFICDYIPSPFILGVLKPKIFLPSTLDPQQQDSVIAHERAHIVRLDHWWKPLGFFLLSVHWFNPMVWIAYALLCRDIEMACDEKVIEKMTPAQKQAYSTVLLTCSMPRKAITACPLAFGESGVKERIRGILNYRKPPFWVVLISLLLCMALAVGFLSNPVRTEDYLRFTKADVRRGQPHTYRFDLHTGKQVQGPIVFAELWRNGELMQSEYCRIPDAGSGLAVTTTAIREDDSVSGCRVQIDTNPYAAVLDVTFALPEGTTPAEEYSWHGPKDIPLEPDKQILLAASIFDCNGDGFFLFDFDNEDYAASGSRLQNQDCTVLVYAVFPAKTVSKAEDAIRYELNTFSGPESIAYGDLHFALPEGWFLNMVERKDAFPSSSGTFVMGDAIVGGIRSYSIREEVLLKDPEWMFALDFREWEDPMLDYSAESFRNNRSRILFFRDVPPDSEQALRHEHNLFYADGRIYDLWFDELATQEAARQEILASAVLDKTASDAEEGELAIVQEVLQTLLNCTQAQSAEMDAYLTATPMQPQGPGIVSGGMDLVEFARSQYHGLLTEECLAQILTNRSLFQAAALTKTYGADISADEYSFLRRKGTQPVWGYSALLLAGDQPVAQASGTVTLTDTPSSPQVTNLTLKLTKVHPEPETAGQTAELNQWETPNSLNVLLRPTSAIALDGLGAYCPDDQAEWISAWNNLRNAGTSASDNASPESYYGAMLHYEDTYLSLHKGSQGFFLQDTGAKVCYSPEASRPLTDLLEPVLEQFFYQPVKPAELKGLHNASLRLDGKNYSILQGDPKLQQLETILTSGKPAGYMTACWFTALLTVSTEDGRLYTISPATDSCSAYLSDGVVYEFPGDNAVLYQLFGVDLAEPAHD